MNLIQPDKPHILKEAVSMSTVVFSLAAAVLVLFAIIFLHQKSLNYDHMSEPTNTNQRPLQFSINVDSEIGEASIFYEAKNTEEELGGRIHMTLVDVNAYPQQQGELAALQMYEYVPGTSTKPTPIPDINSIAFMSDRRTADNMTVFGSFAPLFKLDSTADLNTDRVLATHSPQIFVKHEGDAQQISTTTALPSGEQIARKRTPKIAHNSDRVVYSAQTNNPDGSMRGVYPLNTWHILQTDTETREDTYVTSGAHAVWSSDDEYIFFVRADGIYAKKMTSEDGLEGRIIPAPNEFDGLRYDTQLQISNDGNYLIFNYLTYANNGTKVDAFVEIHEIGQSQTSELPETELVYKLHIENGMVFWPVLSPEGRYMTLQLAESTNPNAFTVESQRIAVFDIVSGEIVEEISFDGFDFLSAFTTSWTEL